MEIKNKIGIFDQPIESLVEVKTIRELIESNTPDYLTSNFTKVNVIFKRQTLKTGVVVYSMSVSLHPNIDFTLDNRKIINQNEFLLICLNLGLPVDSDVLKFKGYVRFIKGISDSPKIRTDDKSYVRIELFISPDLMPISCFLDSGTRLAMNKLSMLDELTMRKIHSIALPDYKVFSVSKKFIDQLESDTETENE